MATPKVSPFTTSVVAAMRKLYPEELADSSFDNTGLLLEAPYRPHLKNTILLTVDLTQAVADEAIAKKNSIIIAYHPIIFRPLKSLTSANTQQHTLLRLAQEGISVYSPHTALDAVTGGINDWLCDAITRDLTSDDSIEPNERSVITSVKDAPPGFENAGYGRIVRFGAPQELRQIVQRIALNMGLRSVSLAVPQQMKEKEKFDTKISSVGICAGSGGSLLNGLDVDLLFTGELSHHEALAATEKGKCVITTYHSNSERGFLKQRMVSQLCAALDEAGAINETPTIYVSEIDRDPYETVSFSNADR